MQRIPDSSGLIYWNEQLTGGVFGANQVVEYFLFSDKIGAKVAAMTNEDYMSEGRIVCHKDRIWQILKNMNVFKKSEE